MSVPASSVPKVRLIEINFNSLVLLKCLLQQFLHLRLLLPDVAYLLLQIFYHLLNLIVK